MLFDVTMGWLFGKKKVPQVPFPEPSMPDEGELNFPSSFGVPKVIQPKNFKAAAGLDDFLPPPLPPQATGVQKQSSLSIPKSSPVPFSRPSFPLRKEAQPVHVKIEEYKKLLGEIDSLTSNLHALHAANSKLQHSEYNEDETFARLRKNVRTIHDHLLDVDKILFSRGQ